jgi:hypothetical protein
MATQRKFFVAKPYYQGNGVVMVLEKPLRDALEWRPGDLVLIRLHEPYATLRVGKPQDAIDLRALKPEDLPPAWIPRSTNATKQTDQKGTPAGTTGPDASQHGRTGTD